MICGHHGQQVCVLAPRPHEALVAPATGGGRKRVFKRNTRVHKKGPHLQARRRLLQDQETTSAVEAEMSVGIWTLGEMGPDGSSHKLCQGFRKRSVKRLIFRVQMSLFFSSWITKQPFIIGVQKKNTKAV